MRIFDKFKQNGFKNCSLLALGKLCGLTVLLIDSQFYSFLSGFERVFFWFLPKSVQHCCQFCILRVQKTKSGTFSLKNNGFEDFSLASDKILDSGKKFRLVVQSAFSVSRKTLWANYFLRRKQFYEVFWTSNENCFWFLARKF